MTIKEIKANNGNLYLEAIKEIPYNNSLLIVGRKIKFEKEVGVFEIHDAIEEIYIPANDDVEQLENVEWWMKIPQNKK